MHLAKYDPSRLGGGWTFMRNFAKGLGYISANYQDAEIFFISGASMLNREEVNQAKIDGKKIILRVDNAIRNSRNRNTGMSRLYDFAQMADLIIYQSSWAKDYLQPFIKKDGAVILNGCDLDIFYPEHKFEGSIIYSRFNRDETKNWEVARYWFATENALGKLYITGNFSPELVEGNFDFYNNEDYEYLGSLSENNYSKLLRRMESFLYTYFNDACSNSLIEALCSGCKVIDPGYFLKTGGAAEIMVNFTKKGRDYFSLQRMTGEYIKVFNELL